VVFYGFDLLNFNARSLVKLPLVEGKAMLSQVLHKAPDQLRLVGFLDGDPDLIVQEICCRQLEGVVAKRATSRYEPGKRSGAWVKFKCGLVQEFVIGGFTVGKRGRAPFGALIVGCNQRGRLRYASKVGSGFGGAELRATAMCDPHREQRMKAHCFHGNLPFVSRAASEEPLRAAASRLRREGRFALLAAENNFGSPISVVRRSSPRLRTGV